MRRTCTLGLAATLALCLTSPAPCEPFPADWATHWHQVSDGESGVQLTRHDDGSLELDGTPGRHVYFAGGEVMHDFAVTAKVKFLRADDKYSGFSLYTRWNGETWGERDAFWIYLRPKFRALHMQKVLGGKLVDEFQDRIEATRPDATPLGEWMTLRCEMRGTKIEVYLDDELALSANDEGRFPLKSGRVGFGVGDAHIVIADLEQTNLEESAKLTGITYEYVNKPTRGDEGATVLTDGKVNPRGEQAFWRMLGARPEIVFDLGGERFLTKATLRARSSPAVNIASAEFLGSSDKQAWQTLSVLRNSDSRRAEAEHEVSGPIRKSARYVKLILNRPAADQDVELAEVEFYGREPTEQDRLASAAAVYDLGPVMPPTTEGAASDDSYWYLAGRGIRIAVDKQRGLVAGVWNLARDAKCVERLPDKYYLVTRTTDVEASEYDDRVTEVLATDAPKSLKLRCSNPKLPGVTIEKAYSVAQDGRRLVKRVAFTSTTDAPDRFLTHATGGVLPEDFRRGGVYMGCDRGLGARLFADEVTVPKQIGALGARNSKTVLFQRYDLGWGLGHYRYKINDRYCRPLTSRWHEKENHPPVYLPNGWEFGLCTLHLAPKQEQSTEVHLALYEGRQFDFYGMYRNLPEVAEQFAAVKRPAWVRDLKTSTQVALNPLCEDLTGALLPVKRTLQLTETGGLWNLPHIHGVWGDWFTKGVVTNGYGAKIDTRWLNDYFAEVRKLSPRTKLGVYTWAWAVHPRSKVYREHPEWFITTDRNGQVFNAYSNMVLNHARRFGIKESMDELIDQFAQIMQDFGGDFFYLDGGGGGQNLIDWEHLDCDQDYHYLELYRRIREVTRACGDDRAVWFNARTGPYWDIGYYEGIDRDLHASTWRNSADGLSAVKIRHAYDPEQVVIPLYWRTPTLPFFSNYCIGLGITPSSPLGADDQRKKLPFIEAAYEMRGARWIEADLQPDWRTDPDTQIEAYALRHNGAAVLSVIDHRETTDEPATISADTARLGLDGNKPVYAWTFGVRDIRESWFALPESTRREINTKTGWGLDLIGRLLDLNVIEKSGERIEVAVPTEPHLLRMVFLSNSPAAIFSVGGRRTNFWLPRMHGAAAQVRSSADGQRGVLQTTAPEGGAEVVVWDKGLVVVRVPEGEHEVALSGVDGVDIVDGRPRGHRLGVQCPTQTEAGGGLALRLDPAPDRAAASVWRNDVLVYAGEHAVEGGTVTLDVPGEIHPGSVEIRVAAESDGKLLTGTATVNVTSDFHPDLVPVYLPKAAAKLNLADVGKTVKGIRVLRTGTNTHDGYDGGLHAETGADRLLVSGGNVDAPRSRYGYGFAGLELEGARVLTLRIANTFYDAWCFYRNRVSFKPQYTSIFAGMFVDYHTGEGYTRRVALGCGLLNPKRTSPKPDWGTKSAPHEFVSLGDLIQQGAETTLTIDLAKWAPPGWDGRCWLSAGAHSVLPSRRLTVQILGNADSPEGKDITEGEALGDATKIKEYVIGQAKQRPKIDGNVDDAVWKQLAAATGFTLLGRLSGSKQATKAWLAYDQQNLYVAFDCQDTEKQQPNTAAKKIWNQDAIDFALDVDADRQDFQQIIVNANGDVEQFTQGAEGRKTEWKLTAAAARRDAGWSVEVAIPWTEIGAKPKPGAKWTGNFVRYRPYPPVDEMLSWSHMPGPAINEAARFGVLRFE